LAIQTDPAARLRAQSLLEQLETIQKLREAARVELIKQAHKIKPEYQTPEMLTPQTDPPPQNTQQIRALLSDIMEGHDSPAMTEAHRAFYNNLPSPAKNELTQQLKTLNALTYITSDEVEGRGLRINEPISRIRYYKGELGQRVHYFTFWLTKEGKVAHLRFYAE
jgi:hypothetical protein